MFHDFWITTYIMASGATLVTLLIIRTWWLGRNEFGSGVMALVSIGALNGAMFSISEELTTRAFEALTAWEAFAAYVLVLIAWLPTVVAISYLFVKAAKRITAMRLTRCD
jgi:hypothetical protein